MDASRSTGSAGSAIFELTESVLQQCRYLNASLASEVVAVSLYLPLPPTGRPEAFHIACERIAEEHELNVKVDEHPGGITLHLSRRQAKQRQQ
jgi:hypothetical protein